MATKPILLLIGEGLKAEVFNDDVLGRTLDKLYRAGPETVFIEITHGFSKDGRPDLKQFVMKTFVASSYRSSYPSSFTDAVTYPKGASISVNPADPAKFSIKRECVNEYEKMKKRG